MQNLRPFEILFTRKSCKKQLYFHILGDPLFDQDARKRPSHDDETGSPPAAMRKTGVIVNAKIRDLF